MSNAARRKHGAHVWAMFLSQVRRDGDYLHCEITLRPAEWRDFCRAAAESSRDMEYYVAKAQVIRRETGDTLAIEERSCSGEITLYWQANVTIREDETRHWYGGGMNVRGANPDLLRVAGRIFRALEAKELCLWGAPPRTVAHVLRDALKAQVTRYLSEIHETVAADESALDSFADLLAFEETAVA